MERNMNAYKFDVKVGKDGSIHLPYLSDLINQEAEVIIVLKTPRSPKVKSNRNGQNFLKLWAGFISEYQESPSRIEYISEIYK